MKPSRALGAAVVAALLSATPVIAQSPDSSRAGEALRVFLDCRNAWCDFDFLRTDITFVDWVRDRKAAQLHLLVTSQQTGAGGREYTLDFVGQEKLAGSDQQLTFVTLPAESDDVIRRGLARTIKLGLARYVANTPLASRLDISYSKPVTADSSAKPTRDPWNYWVFRIRANGNLNGESRYQQSNYFGNLSANRTTEQWKIRINGYGSYGESQYILESPDSPPDTSRNYTHRYGGEVLTVKSLGKHWSAGGSAEMSSSSFSNEKLILRIGPAVEYNLFPYSQSTRRRLTLLYGVRANRFLYDEETIFFVTRENRWDHLLAASYQTTEKWGNVSISVFTTQYFFDPTKRNLNLNGNGEFRLFRGFSVNFFSGYSLIRDQLSLARGGASPTEVLLRLRELKTDYRYYGGFGLSYTFGSIFNSIVNPRFD